MADELKRLRQEALRLHKNVSNKISRIKRSSGANIEGTEFDPRRSTESLKRANRATLRKAIDEMKPFLGRNVQFSAGAYGSPLPRHRAKLFESLQGVHNTISDQHSEQIRSNPAPGNADKPKDEQMTIGNIKAMQHMPTADGGGQGLGPWKTDSKSLRGISNAKALEKLIAEKMKQIDPNYLSSKLKQGKHNAIEAAKKMGNLQLIEGINRLSEYQFDVLWYGTAFAENLFDKYKESQSAQEEDASRKESIEARVVDEQYELLGELLQYAETEIPVNRPETVGKKTKNNRSYRR